MNFRRHFVPGLLAGSMLVAGASGAFAANHTRAYAAHVAGQVSNLTSTGFTLTWTPAKTTTSKSIQVTVAATTKQRALKGTTGLLANGEYALAIGVRTGNTLVASRVIFSTAPLKPGVIARRVNARAAGTVNTALSTPTSLVITTKSGKTLTFTITPQTKYHVNKQLTATAPAFTSGEKVIVLFKRDAATKTLIARAVIVRTTTTP